MWITLSLCVGSAPCASSSSTTARCPPAQARDTTVWSLLAVALFTLAPGQEKKKYMNSKCMRYVTYFLSCFQIKVSKVKGLYSSWLFRTKSQSLTFADKELHCTEMSCPRCLHQGRPPPFRLMFLENKDDKSLVRSLEQKSSKLYMTRKIWLNNNAALVLQPTNPTSHNRLCSIRSINICT